MEQSLSFLYGALFESSANVLFLTLWGIIVTEFVKRFIASSCSMIPPFFQKRGELMKMRLRYEGRTNAAAGVSVLIPAHNCAERLQETIDSLNEQTLDKFELIVVNDGSSDNTDYICQKLLIEKRIHKYIFIKSRGGKAAALNAAERIAQYPFLVICDAGTTLNNDAIEIGMAYFSDPMVAGVAGNVSVRNSRTNLLTLIQSLDYPFSALMSRGILRMMDFGFVVSGALGFYRRSAFQKVGGYTPGTGEDLELALALRYLGWKVDFSIFSTSLTDVPDTIGSFIRQRLRWDRDATRIILKKYTKLVMNPFTHHFDLWLTLGILDFYFVNLIFSIMAYIYIVYFYHLSGSGFSYLLVGSFLLYLAFMFIYSIYSIILLDKQNRKWSILLLVPFYILFKELLVRPIWIFSVFTEMIFSTSSQDPFVPKKVRDALGKIKRRKSE